MNLIQKFHDGFMESGRQPAFCGNDETFGYDEFFSFINGSRKMLEQQTEFSAQQPVGVLCNEKVETYAAIFAIWFTGGIFVPLNPDLPAKLMNEIILKHHIQVVFANEPLPAGLEDEKVTVLNNGNVTADEDSPLYHWKADDLMYILTTSGSTGIPKIVPISNNNVEAFVEGFLEMYPELNSSDNFLQTYDLTADASFTGYLIPFLLGATVYVVPKGDFKPFQVAKVLSGYPITWVQVTPSMLACLHPFFQSLHLDQIKHFHFGGEALPADLVEELREHIPNAEISNVYGPTETTITATVYKCAPGEAVKAQNNIVSIGRALKNVDVFIQREADCKHGELFIAGRQVMENYMFAETQPFKYVGSGSVKYYPTGDYVEVDEDGYLFFTGRIDEQVKLSGYRVDLIEVENSVRSLLPKTGNVAAVVYEKSKGMLQLVVFIENYSGNGNELIRELFSVLPHYKVPEKIIGLERFPVTSSGKTDKKALVGNFLNQVE